MRVESCQDAQGTATRKTPERGAGPTPVALTVLVPTFNEGANCARLVDRVTAAMASDLPSTAFEILFVDDSTDGTPDLIRSLAEDFEAVRMVHRAPSERQGGLAGAVVHGFRVARGDVVVVMDGDLQHPPELVPELAVTLFADETFDLVVASRYCGSGDASGLSSSWRRSVSSVSTALARACFPARVASKCSDPMTGFFAMRLASIDLTLLRPRGFKILLEILARQDLRAAELPFAFGERLEGASKASWRNGFEFLRQLLGLRFGRMTRFAMVGAVGTVVNLIVLQVLIGFHLPYVWGAVVAAEVSILHNFFAQELLVFRDQRAGHLLTRLGSFVAFNNIDALLRVPLLVLLVERTSLTPVPAQAVLLGVAFVARFLFTSRVVYRPRRQPETAFAPTSIDLRDTVREPSREAI